MRRLILCVVMATISGCSECTLAPTPEASTAVKAVSFNSAGAPTIEFNAPDMMCAEGCGAKVNEILSKQPGAKEVLVDFDAKKATVAISPDAKFDADAAIAALVDHGFKNSSIKSAAAEIEPINKPQAPNDGAVQ